MNNNNKFYNITGMIVSLIGVILMFSSVYYGIWVADAVILNSYNPIDTSIYELAVSKYINAFHSLGLVILLSGLIMILTANFKKLFHS
ncbi:hypothetical protein [Salipaludibacillus aurantiacus]|uniref:Menaquinol-cytochrome c reductase cytochrome b subunit n=1 Tax=Salipaludibacillus aurantiacus TaxID=1601833 RepID=A0A1H9W607_9BACI|nr:hypothetical protein [Salipaludibacillus aurantiacus]SES29211.1 hypothetical protein SAMN05518684_11494 [Salipaludibacillus aurantiacus]